MGEICAKSGKELSWLESKQDPKYRDKRVPRFQEKYPQFLGKKLCKPCNLELQQNMHGYDAQRKMYKCQYCGQEYRHIHSCTQAPQVKDHWEKPFKEALEQGRRIVVIKDAVLSPDGIGKHIETYSKVAEKFGYAYKSETHFPDAIGISLTLIFEKVIPTANETNFVNCEHCTTRYDANQYFKCPNCGSPTT